MFYAESWGLTHFLMFGKGMGNGEQMKTYLTLLQQKKDSVEAFEQSFGKLDQLNEQFEKYLRTFQLKAMAYNTPLGIDPATIPTGPMPVAETDARMGDFFNYLGSSDKAEEWLKAALAADSKSALAHENMGFAEFREGNDEEAEKEFDEAVMLAPDSYLAVYYQAMLRYQRKTDAESLTKLDAAMGQVMQLNPFFAPPFIERSEIYVKEGKLQDAFNVALQGQKLEPDRAGYVTRMAAILLLGHNYPAAVKTGSLVVSRWTYNDGAEAIAVINEARRVGKIEPTTEEQALENDEMKYAKDTMAAEGEVKSVSCEKSKPIELVLQNGDQEFEFQGGQYGAGFTDTLWYGKDHFNPCHHIEGLRAVVRYKLSADQPPKNEMKWLEIRDSLVPNSVPAPAN
jgi:tetratricopeptide (TPR) repeat protein